MQIAKGASAAGEMFKVIDRVPLIDSLSDSGERPEECTGNIQFSQVSFFYPSRPHVPVLKGLDLSIPASKTTALVGGSGSGKSTVTGLLERWYEPSSGCISLDGRDIKELNIKWLRTNIRIVQQVMSILTRQWEYILIPSLRNLLCSTGPYLKMSPTVWLAPNL